MSKVNNMNANLKTAVMNWLAIHKPSPARCACEPEHNTIVEGVISDLQGMVDEIEWPNNLAFLHADHKCEWEDRDEMFRKNVELRKENDFLRRKIDELETNSE